jgi:hypothetical protein
VGERHEALGGKIKARALHVFTRGVGPHNSWTVSRLVTLYFLAHAFFLSAIE